MITIIATISILYNYLCHTLTHTCMHNFCLNPTPIPFSFPKSLPEGGLDILTPDISAALATAEVKSFLARKDPSLEVLD